MGTSTEVYRTLVITKVGMQSQIMRLIMEDMTTSWFMMICTWKQCINKQTNQKKLAKFVQTSNIYHAGFKSLETCPCHLESKNLASGLKFELEFSSFVCCFFLLSASAVTFSTSSGAAWGFVKI